MLKLLTEPIPDALSDAIDPAWEAATDSRQRLKCSYAMDATMPEQANHRPFPGAIHTAPEHGRAPCAGAAAPWAPSGSGCAQKLPHSDHKSGHWE